MRLVHYTYVHTLQIYVWFTLGGYNVRQLDPVWFRKHIGLVSQEPVLFATSIADNIAYGKDDATESEVCNTVTFHSLI